MSETSQLWKSYMCAQDVEDRPFGRSYHEDNERNYEFLTTRNEANAKRNTDAVGRIKERFGRGRG